MTDPAAHTDLERRLAAADSAARQPESIEHLLETISPMTEERWDSLAIDDLTEDEADTFWQAIAGVSAVVVDTGVFSAPLIARRAVGQTLQDQYRRHLIGQQLVIATQTLAELHFGAEFANWGTPRRARLDALVDTAAVVAPDQPMCRRFGSLRADLRRTGHPLHQDHHVGDLWIATTAIHYGLPLVTHDKVFARCPGLDVRTEV